MVHLFESGYARGLQDSGSRMQKLAWKPAHWFMFAHSYNTRFIWLPSQAFITVAADLLDAIWVINNMKKV